MKRRAALGLLTAAPLLGACRSAPPRDRGDTSAPGLVLESAVLLVEPLGATWKTPDPFLFCAHHDDAYPAGNGKLGPDASLTGRQLGSDFAPEEAWRMYHGNPIPGFPQHPHRGFETVTVVRRGLVDHADSLGAAARYGEGDVQWLTAGKGIVHAEMFPLLDVGAPNPLELFQIWLNLPAADKMVEPHFSMLWSPSIPRQAILDSAGKATKLTIVAGGLGGNRAPDPPPKSWAARPDSDVAIWTLEMPPGGRFTLPRAQASSNRRLYFYRGKSLRVGALDVASGHFVDLRADSAVTIENGPEPSGLLMLQGQPIAEPVARRGPFVMNTAAEIDKAYADYRATRFGGWPWPKDGPVHDLEGRFARHASGRTERGTLPHVTW